MLNKTPVTNKLADKVKDGARRSSVLNAGPVSNAKLEGAKEARRGTLPVTQPQ